MRDIVKNKNLYIQLPESNLYFSELSGESGIKSLIPMQFGSNPDFIIALALLIREKNLTINKLQESEVQKSPRQDRFFTQ